MRRRASHKVAGAFASIALATGSLAVAAAARAQDQSAATTQNAIAARKTLMDFMCDRMTEIEVMVGGGSIDLKIVHQYADAMSAMFMGFPHLFPPSSNLWKRDPNADPVTETLASPDVWARFADFYQQAQDSAKLARELAHASTNEDAQNGARELRIACDACHALYLEEP